MLNIHKASAGSGKTFSLARQYIKLLLGYKNKETGQYILDKSPWRRHRTILAITFTNKATEEMKSRIIHELAVLADLEPGWTKQSDHLSYLTDVFNCTDADLKTAADMALKQLLYDFSFFNVSTIDSFFQTVLRTFAREAEIPGNYDLDLDARSAIVEGVERTFDSISADSTIEPAKKNQLIEWITKFMLSKLSIAKKATIFNRKSKLYEDLIKFVENLTKDKFIEHRQQLFDYLSDPHKLAEFASQIDQLIIQFRRQAINSSTTALHIIESRGYDTDKKLKINGLLLKKLIAIGKNKDFGSDLGQTVPGMMSNPDKAFSKDLNKLLQSKPDPELYDAIQYACKCIWEHYTYGHQYLMITENIYFMGLLFTILTNAEDYRSENNTILLSDTNNLLHDIIGDDDAPFVYERVGLWLNHFLIDEFQDTSRLQWQNMQPLLNEGQSDNNDSLIIGDEKQCIYRFRNSDPSLLHHEVADYYNKQAEVTGKTIAENTNWRSSARVVRFNNKFFNEAAESLNFSHIYGNVEQQVSPKNEKKNHGYVRINHIMCGNSTLATPTTLQLLTEQIIQQIQAGYPPSQIAVLVRNAKEGIAVIDYLMDQCATNPQLKDVTVMSDDSMLISSSPAVRRIISVMRYLASAEEDVDTLRAEKEALAGKKSRQNKRAYDISKLISRFEYFSTQPDFKGEPLMEAIKSLEANSPISDIDPADFKSSQSAKIVSLNLQSLVESIIERFIIPENNTDRANNENLYISSFVDTLTDYCSHAQATDLRAFLRWWDESGYKTKVTSSDEPMAIRVMTIHKSKGLEFKCVHIPFVNWPLANFKDPEWFYVTEPFYGIDPKYNPPMIPLRPSSWMADSQFASQYDERCNEMILDEFNVLYVAMTRAIDSLTLSYNDYGASANKAGALLNNSATIKELSLKVADGYGYPVEIFTEGEPTQFEKEDKPLTAIDPKGKFEMPAYQSHYNTEHWKNIKLDDYINYSAARQRGIILHDILSRIITARDIEHAVSSVANEGNIPLEDVPELTAALHQLIEQPEIAPWFDPKCTVYCERSILLTNGKIRRPDRVIVNPDGSAVVVDYKFARENEAEYSQQVLTYMNTLKAAGYPAVEGYLWYVDTNTLRRVE